METRPKKLDYTGIWMWCSDCGGKLYEIDADKDHCRECPTKKECKIDDNSKNLNYPHPF